MTASWSRPSPTIARVAFVTIPPFAISGIFGTEKPLPPMPGTHDGTWRLIRPTVLFQILAMKLNAALKTFLIALPIHSNGFVIAVHAPEKKLTSPFQIPSAIALIPVHAAFHTVLTTFMAPEMTDDRMLTAPRMTATRPFQMACATPMSQEKTAPTPWITGTMPRMIAARAEMIGGRIAPRMLITTCMTAMNAWMITFRTGRIAWMSCISGGIRAWMSCISGGRRAWAICMNIGRSAWMTCMSGGRMVWMICIKNGRICASACVMIGMMAWATWISDGRIAFIMETSCGRSWTARSPIAWKVMPASWANMPAIWPIAGASAVMVSPSFWKTGARPTAKVWTAGATAVTTAPKPCTRARSADWIFGFCRIPVMVPIPVAMIEPHWPMTWPKSGPELTNVMTRLPIACATWEAPWLIPANSPVRPF